MEALLATNPDILQRLKADLAELASRRLHSLGVDPTWRGLPAGTYKDKVATLAHQRNITAKVATTTVQVLPLCSVCKLAPVVY